MAAMSTRTMTKPGKIVILGSSGHGLAVWDACLSAGFTPIGFVDPAQSSSRVEGLPVVPNFSEIDLTDLDVALGIGHNFARERAAVELLEEYPGVRMPVIVHRTAWVSPSATLEAGTVVLAQASVGPFATTGRGALLNTGSSLDHESTLDDFASLGPGSHTGGQVFIGARTMVGLNAGILQGISIGSDTVIGGQSLVRTDIPAGTVAFGVPCAPVRTRLATDIY
jgi:sugar O-acyltransferase (sialic acid O-acetyltransferase NeuD family)